MSLQYYPLGHLAALEDKLIPATPASVLLAPLAYQLNIEKKNHVNFYDREQWRQLVQVSGFGYASKSLEKNVSAWPCRRRSEGDRLHNHLRGSPPLMASSPTGEHTKHHLNLRSDTNLRLNDE
ncbi:unnamed protein product [Nippostrongylus brasiliensis]|uniref:Uncharacterized protein n=1 Tax=Nippostrongylus brasiliensis TaxID=27835 RepID=A0A0N4Y4M8_NIPBR|nr:unnamed protein product [Nippostrongylus brasiliensis]